MMSNELPDLQTLAERIKWARNRAGLGISELSRSIDEESRDLVNDIERGKRKNNPPKITQIATVLKVPVSWLLTGSVDQSLTENENKWLKVIIEITKKHGQALSLDEISDWFVYSYQQNKYLPFDDYNSDDLEKLVLSDRQRMIEQINNRSNR